ncbi:MAG: phage tail protein [Acidobacteriota bacterium]|nr:phage tail protein [Acidobacteriota bacterium]
MSSTPTPPPATLPSAFSSSRFVVAIDGMVPTAFTEVTGLQASAAVVEVREGSDPGSIRKQPGQTSYENLILVRPLTKDLSLWNWMQQSLAGSQAKRNLSVTLLDSQENPAIRWSLRNAFPVKWTGPTLNAVSNDIAIETLELAYEQFSVTAA